MESDPASSFTTEDPLALRDRIVAEAEPLFARGYPEAAIALLRRLEDATIDETTLRLTDPLLGRWIARGRKIVASFDPNRLPASDEIVIVYGNYPHCFANVVVNNPIKRHVASFWEFEHDRVEYDVRWDSVDRIYLINAGSRVDRFDAVLRELAAARAPFHKIVRLTPEIRRREGEPQELSGTIGCLESHLDAALRARAAGHAHTLVLEDDFSFTSDIEQHLQDLGLFFQRRYPYWICLIATSKYGRIDKKDDLVSLSYQPCTNAGGYIVSHEGLGQLIPVQEAALEALLSTGDTQRYAADRCWAVLQGSGKFLVFRTKFGFQAASYSNIEAGLSRYFD
jgi:hypothetical protein